MGWLRVWLLATLLCLPLQATTLRLVTLQYPPYVYEENGQIQGAAFELVREAFHRSGYPIDVRVLPWGRALQLIESGEADGIFTLFKTPERERFADFSEEVLLEQSVSLFVRQDATIAFDGDLDALASFRFGLVRNVSYGERFDGWLRQRPELARDLSHTGEANMNKLLRGRFDILVSNSGGAHFILARLAQQDRVRALKPEIQRIPSYLAFSKQRHLEPVRRAFDEALRSMHADGSYQRIVSAYGL
ncbi:substrate-binding periplasmic protein [Aeromonas diversa]|uniref:substrate-binding periplasmic protein n=1 Tax=Aeromonas diversa TaxID=502790 RepID=UPI00399F230D